MMLRTNDYLGDKKNGKVASRNSLPLSINISYPFFYFPACISPARSTSTYRRLGWQAYETVLLTFYFGSISYQPQPLKKNLGDD